MGPKIVDDPSVGCLGRISLDFSVESWVWPCEQHAANWNGAGIWAAAIEFEPDLTGLGRKSAAMGRGP